MALWVLQDACQRAFQAWRPTSHVYVPKSVECFVVGLPEPGTRERDDLGARVEHTHRGGERIETRFSPRLATLEVDILPDQPADCGVAGGRRRGARETGYTKRALIVGMVPTLQVVRAAAAAFVSFVGTGGRGGRIPGTLRRPPRPARGAGARAALRLGEGPRPLRGDC